MDPTEATVGVAVVPRLCSVPYKEGELDDCLARVTAAAAVVAVPDRLHPPAHLRNPRQAVEFLRHLHLLPKDLLRSSVRLPQHCAG